MAQRRVAPSGFGGSAGLSILQGVAQGRVQREQMDEENQRRAVLNRLSRTQMDQMQQNMRLSREENERLQTEFDREQRMTEAAVGNLKNYAMQERGMTAEEAEEWAMARASGLTSRHDIEQDRANLAQTQSATRANQTSTQVNEEKLRQVRIDQTAKQLLSSPRLLKILSLPDSEFSASSKHQVIQTVMDRELDALKREGIIPEEMDTEHIEEATDRAMELLRDRDRAEVGAFFEDQNSLRRAAREVEQAVGGDTQKAIQQIQSKIQENPELAEDGRAMIAYLRSRESSFGGVGAGEVGAEMERASDEDED